MSLAILGLGTAVPPCAISQRRAAELTSQISGHDAAQSDRLAFLYGLTGITRRHVSILDEGGVVPDALWERIQPILKGFWPRKATGRPPAHWRRTLNGIIFRSRSGCQWDQLPERYGPKSTVHDWFQRWAAGGVLEKVWAVLVAESLSRKKLARKRLIPDGL